MTVSNPAQRRVLSELRGVGVERPTFDPALAMALRERIETSLEDLAGELDRPLWASKQALSRILGCEAHHVSGADSPGPSPLREGRWFTRRSSCR